MILGVLFFQEPQVSKPPRHHQVVEIFGSDFSDPFDWQKKGPIDLITHLRAAYKKDGPNLFHVSGYHIGWIRKEDLPQIEAVVHSTDPCLALQDPYSSHLDFKGSTVGAVATELLDSFKSGGFPTWNKGRAKK